MLPDVTRCVSGSEAFRTMEQTCKNRPSTVTIKRGEGKIEVPPVPVTLHTREAEPSHARVATLAYPCHNVAETQLRQTRREQGRLCAAAGQRGERQHGEQGRKPRKVWNLHRQSLKFKLN